MPFTTVQWSLFGLPVRGFYGTGNGFKRSHCSLLKSPRFTIATKRSHPFSGYNEFENTP
ncbi:hypothetical protein ACF3DV_33465 (plasmid) [Chlorogloeopsis fritschii PCC 9212]|uniref:hypothetical protein n=1 Tax=Chlorogloeopsis fritschii TaxID=1124 RepID=UPI0012F6FF7A|nr:hypothetical protein [Chlorogloeopsis fritschii]